MGNRAALLLLVSHRLSIFPSSRAGSSLFSRWFIGGTARRQGVVIGCSVAISGRRNTSEVVLRYGILAFTEVFSFFEAHFLVILGFCFGDLGVEEGVVVAVLICVMER